MLLLALLGLTNVAYSLPLNDKPLHFFCLEIATEILYFCSDVGENNEQGSTASFLYLNIDEYGSGAIAR